MAPRSLLAAAALWGGVAGEQGTCGSSSGAACEDTVALQGQQQTVIGETVVMGTKRSTRSKLKSKEPHKPVVFNTWGCPKFKEDCYDSLNCAWSFNKGCIPVIESEAMEPFKNHTKSGRTQWGCPPTPKDCAKSRSCGWLTLEKRCVRLIDYRTQEAHRRRLPIAINNFHQYQALEKSQSKPQKVRTAKVAATAIKQVRKRIKKAKKKATHLARSEANAAVKKAKAAANLSAEAAVLSKKAAEVASKEKTIDETAKTAIATEQSSAAEQTVATDSAIAKSESTRAATASKNVQSIRRKRKAKKTKKPTKTKLSGGAKKTRKFTRVTIPLKITPPTMNAPAGEAGQMVSATTATHVTKHADGTWKSQGGHVAANEPVKPIIMKVHAKIPVSSLK